MTFISELIEIDKLFFANVIIGKDKSDKYKALRHKYKNHYRVRCLGYYCRTNLDFECELCLNMGYLIVE